MKCSKCRNRAVYAKPNLCSRHLVAYVRKTALDTIKKHKLLSKKDKLIVAVSGGKDSLTLLDILSLKYQVDALAIDEGIAHYREHSLKDLRKFCRERKIKLKVVSFKRSFGMTLDAGVKKKKVPPCRVCGVLRRQLLNKHARKYDIIATGHNMDDELQSVFMNLWKGNIELLARLGPRTGVIDTKGFTPRVKPLYFIPEKMVKVYTMVKGIEVKFVECPYAREAFRHKIGVILNKWEADEPGVKQRILNSFLKMLPDLKAKYALGQVLVCPQCGSPSAGGRCQACTFAKSLK